MIKSNLEKPSLALKAFVVDIFVGFNILISTSLSLCLSLELCQGQSVLCYAFGLLLLTSPASDWPVL